MGFFTKKKLQKLTFEASICHDCVTLYQIFNPYMVTCMQVVTVFFLTNLVGEQLAYK